MDGDGRSTIPERQNDAESLRLLRAKSARYDAARRLWWFQIVASVLLPAMLAAWQLVSAGVAGAAAMYGLAIFCLDFLFDAKKKQLTTEGALVQELFDNRLFDLRWSANRGTAPGEDEVERWASGHPSAEGLRDWYAPEVGALPSWLAPLACHAINGGWDREMRRRQAAAGVSLLLIAAALLAGWGTAVNASMTSFVLVASTVLPIISWAAKDLRQQREIAVERAKVRERADAAWSEALAAVANGKPAVADARAALADLQYEIFRQRRDSPPVLNWFYARHREEDERAMCALATARVAAYEEAVAKARETAAVNA